MRFSGWSTGTITATTETTVKVSFDGEPAEEDTELPRTSPNLAPLGAHSGGIEWRQGLKKGSLIDCMDTTAAWYRSTVLETREDLINGKQVLMVKIGYRRYEETGSKKDSEGNLYNGWSSTYDEWVNAFSIRIKRPDTIAKIGKIMCKKALDEEDKEKPHVEDTTDVLLNSVEGEEIYAILRPEKVKSAAVANMFNAFGKEGGFDKILQRMADKSKPVPYGLTFLREKG